MSKAFGFTQSRIEKLTCPKGEKRIHVRDTQTRGLCVQVTAAGTKTFYLYAWIKGAARRIAIGKFPDITIDAARNIVQTHKGEIAKGNNPAEERNAARGEMTFDDLFTRYLNGHAKPKKKDKGAEDEAQYKLHLQSIKSRKLSEIKWEHINALHAKLGKKHPYAANRLLALLSKVFNYARKVGFTGDSPCKGIEKFPEQQRVRWLDADEMVRFRKSLDDDDDELMADFFRLALFTAAPRSNVQAMAWSNVNFGRREWTVSGEKTKNGDPLIVGLTDEALDVLRRRWEQRIQGNDHVFPSHGVHGHIVEPKAAWSRVLERAKIKDFRLHDLRHTAASWMASSGISLPIVGTALGHRSQQSTARYSHIRQAAAAAALQGATSAMMRRLQQNRGRNRRDYAAAGAITSLAEMNASIADSRYRIRRPTFT